MIRLGRRNGLRPDAIRGVSSSVPSGVTLFSLTDRASDAALVAALALGDEAAAVAFVRRFERRVFGLAVSVTRDRGLAEDVSQETFLRAWKAAGTYDIRRGSVLTWLLTITRNLAIDAVRARRATPTDDAVLDNLIATTLRDPSGDVDQQLDAAQSVQHLRELPPEQARAVVLAVVGGNTAQQVADHEGIPLGTAKTRIRTGLLRMRQALEVEP